MRILILFFMLAVISSQAFSAVTVTVNGSNHTIPQTNEKGWGTNVTAWIQAISQYTLQPNGGTFNLTAEVNTGATYGFKVPYIKTATSTPSTAGVLRLANTDSLGWRNAGNDGNLLLTVDSSDNLLFNGIQIATTSTGSFADDTFEIFDESDPTKKIAFQASGISGSTTRTITVPDANVNLGALTNSNIDASAAIADTKLDTIATAGKVSNSATTATAANTSNAIMARGASGEVSVSTLSATTVVGALTGNASTATALASNPSDCGSNTFAQSIAASGNLTCAAVSLSSADTTGITPVSKGGTGLGTLSAGTVLVGSGSTSISALAIGSTSQVLTVVSGAPSWQTPVTNAAGSSVLTATSGTKTATAANQWQQFTSNSITLTAGRWMLIGSIQFDNSGGAPVWTQIGAAWSAANGADSSSTPAALSTTTNLTVLSAQKATGAMTWIEPGTGSGQAEYMSMSPVIVSVSAGNTATIYINAFANFSGTAANTRITAYGNAVLLSATP